MARDGGDIARRADAMMALRCRGPDSEAGEDVDPTNRRGLLGIIAGHRRVARGELRRD
jgi:hypothetical protein